MSAVGLRMDRAYTARREKERAPHGGLGDGKRSPFGRAGRVATGGIHRNVVILARFRRRYFDSQIMSEVRSAEARGSGLGQSVVELDEPPHGCRTDAGGDAIAMSIIGDGEVGAVR